MKKIVVFSVLLALLSAAVFAQDDGGSGWKVGFYSQLTREFFYSTKAQGESESTTKPNSGDATKETGKLGDYIKGSSNMWTKTALQTPDQRVLASLSNNGDHHSVYIDVAWDTMPAAPTFMGLLNSGTADWWFSGDTGASGGPVVFDAKVGTGRYGGFVSANEIWGPHDWLGSAGHNFFGVQKKDGFQPSNNISTAGVDGNPWASVYALGATFGGNFRLAIGSTLGSFDTGFDNSVASASKVTGAFMLSGKNLGPLAFDLFYAVNGEDKDTIARGTGKWDNLLGAYVGLNIVENLGLSIGYTANFTKVETKQEQKDPTEAKSAWVAYETENPIWSGVDIKVSFNGIDKLGINFNNNISFASAEGVAKNWAKESAGYTRIFGLDGKSMNIPDKTSLTQNWFAYNAVLAVSYSLTDNLGVTLSFFNQLGVYTVEDEDKTNSNAVKTSKVTTTADDFRTALVASYGVGNVSFGLGIQLWIDSNSSEGETKVTGDYGYTTTSKSTFSTVQFAVPIFFKVSI